MAAEPESRLRDLFLEAVELTDPADRDAFLSQVCAQDPVLRARIDALLSADDAGPGDILEESATSASVGSRSPRLRIGHYRILERIGEGGCGTVYLAEQEEPVRRKVALKLIKTGMDTRQVVARFEAERQALALMDHPNIARVFDAGTSDSGQPFFVMEWVRGTRITEFCDANHLDLRGRVELFLSVCGAVHHAHQKGIIHRDLKPSNILVDRPEGSRIPVPKVIDFGIAKAIAGRLTDQTLYTALDQLVGTPAYMSPEQAAGGGSDVDTRADIYSLGVLLYQLLTDQTPFETRDLLAQGFDEMRRTIREVEPERPSARVKRRTNLGIASGTSSEASASNARRHPLPPPPEDLDWIVMKCLEKERARRYETVNSLSQDLQRWLNHETVSARPPSAVNRVRKWIRRNRTTVTAAGAVLLALLGGLVASTTMYVREKRARGDVEVQRAVSDQQRRGFQEHAYASDMKLAQHLVDSHDLEHALEILERHRPTSPGMEDLRGFEWRYLWQACQGSPHDFLPDSVGMPWVLAVSPDGNYVAAASGHKRSAGVTVWRLETKEAVARLDYDPEQESDAAGALFSEDGRWLLTAVHHRIKFFEVGTWKERTEMMLTNASAPIDLRGNTLVSTPSGYFDDPTRIDSFDVWDLRTRTSTRITGVAGPPTLSPDGRRLALRTAAGIEIRSLETPDGPAVLLEDSKGLLTHGSGYDNIKRGLAFSPDGRRIAAPGVVNDRGDIPLAIWDASNGRRIDHGRFIGHSARIHALAWAPDGTGIATASADGTLRLWDPEGREEPRILTGHLSEPWCVTFHPSGNLLFSAGIASWIDKVKLWPLDRPKPRPQVDQEWFPLWLSRDGSQVLVVTQDRDVILRERASGRILESRPMPSGTPPINSESSRLCLIEIGGRPAAFLGYSNGRLASWHFGSTYFPRLFQAHEGAVQAITAITNVGMLVTAGADRTIRWWRLDDGRLVRSNRLEHPVTALAVSPDGKTLMSASGKPPVSGRTDAGFHLGEWDVATGRLRSMLPLPGATADLGFSPDGHWLAAAVTTPQEHSSTHLLDLRSRTWRARFDDIGRELSFSPDGSHLLIWPELWDLRSDPPQAKTLSGHRQIVMHQTFSPDGRTVVSTGDDGTVRLWSVATGQEMLSFVERGRSFDSPVFSADGSALAAGGFTPDGRPLRFWTAPSLAEIDQRIREGRINR
ncbi:MAG: protein kinase [Verrucomicrobiales bacterium]|nr:protein kinase [Verrucomicrobiales bacterium]